MVIRPDRTSARSSASSSRYAQSDAAHAKASQFMPGGVSSPVRSCQSVGCVPVTIVEGSGAWVKDIDGNRYVDYVGSYGPQILGHAHPAIVAAITKAASKGTSFGMPTEAETRLAERITRAMPSIELVRFVNSGTEAVMSALRLARAATRRAKIIKCIGGYHGHSDGLLVQAGSGATTLGIPSSPGVPAGITDLTLLMPYNDLAAAGALFKAHGRDIAALLIEPVAGNMGCVPPEAGYLEGLRKLCDEHEAILIFDEVMTGFRVAYGGAQQIYGITPDLTCLGKVMGGGMPCAAYGGKESLMRQVAPDGPVYQAGTLSGNPVAMAAGLATLDQLGEPGAYKQLESQSALLSDGLKSAAAKAGVSVQINRVGSMLTPFFSSGPVRNYVEATGCDTQAFARFFRSMLDQGVALPPSQFEAWFVSLAHDTEAVEHTLKAAEKAFEASRG